MQVHFAVIFSTVALLLASSVSGAKILCLFGIAGKSHTHVFNALTTELARKGHELTVVTPFPIKDPLKRYIQIDAPITREAIKYFDMSSKMNVFLKIYTMFDYMINICPSILNTPEVQDLKDKKFDLVFVSMFFNECFLPFARHNNAPLILISPAGLISWVSDSIGNPEQYSYVPNMLAPLSDKMSFFERFLNTVINILMTILRNIAITPRMTAAAREYFGEDIPPLDDLMSNASLALINNHISINYPRPLLPNVIEVGGMHIKTF